MRMYITGTAAPVAWERQEDIPTGEPFFSAAELPGGDGELRADQIQGVLYRVKAEETGDPAEPDGVQALAARVGTVESKVDDISSAIERGLA